LFPYKGHRDLIAAASLVVLAVPAVRFLLVGRDAGEMDALRKEVSSLGLERHVLFAGERAEAARIIASSTLVVHPSHEEGFSNTILEAMAAGKAVVATRVGGIPEAVVDGETGLLVPPHDPPALADALLSLLRNPSRAEEMGTAATRRVRDDFSAGKMVSAIEQAYMELLDGRPMSCMV
jgi:glycosyltransferase involved in cell wall biosynthesis